MDPDRGTFFVDSSLLVEAAVSGQGVALARSVLVRDELAAGRLVRPFRLKLATQFAYYLVCPARCAERPKIKSFRDWLFSECERAGGVTTTV